MFILLYIRKRDWRGAATSMILSAVLLTVPFLLTDGNPLILLDNILTFADGSQTGGSTAYHLLFHSIGIDTQGINGILLYALAALTALVPVLFVVLDKELRDWEAVFLLLFVIAILAVSNMSSYFPVFALLPILLYATNTAAVRRTDVILIVLILLTICMIPGAQGIFTYADLLTLRS